MQGFHCGLSQQILFLGTAIDMDFVLSGSRHILTNSALTFNYLQNAPFTKCEVPTLD